MILYKAIPFENIQKFSKIFIDYINQKPSLNPFYDLFPSITNFKDRIENKIFSAEKREIVKAAFQKQYAGYTLSGAVAQNIGLLNDRNTFTVTTGHQLCLFTGPLYFVYKLITTINLAKELKVQYPDYNFVPVYWMASEDHDFEEINHFNLFGKKYEWQSMQKGAVGKFTTNELAELLPALPNEIKEVFEAAYLKHSNLAEATRYVVNTLFSESGLLVLDGNDISLKAVFKDVIVKELTTNAVFEAIVHTNERLANEGYTVQVHPREINLFYLANGIRERIVLAGEIYKVLNTDIKFTTGDILAAAAASPEKFSPNVVLRPLYQEMVLPNLAYIGGPGELAYWLQLKAMFEIQGTEFPLLVPRNFATILNKSQVTKLEKSGLAIESLFLTDVELKKRYVEAKQIGTWDEESYSNQADQLFDAIKSKAILLEKTLEGYIESQRNENLKILENIAKKIRKTAEMKEAEGINQLLNMKSKLFPGGELQERTDNYLNFQLNRPEFVGGLMELFDPFDFKFNTFVLD